MPHRLLSTCGAHSPSQASLSMNCLVPVGQDVYYLLHIRDEGVDGDVCVGTAYRRTDPHDRRQITWPLILQLVGCLGNVPMSQRAGLL